MRGRDLALLLAFGCVAVVGARQEPTTAQIPLRIVVSDPRGRDVKGLSAADLEITEASREHKIESLSRVAAGPRKIAILLDEYHVSEGAAVERASAALQQFARQSLRADDVVFVMKPLDPAASLAPVKSRDQLQELFTAFGGRKGKYAPLTPLEAELMSTAAPSAARQRAQVVRAAMQALVIALNRTEPKGSGVPSALLVVSEGFAPEDRGRERLTSLRVVTRAARMSNVAVYVLDPSMETPSASPFTEPWRVLTTQTGGVLTTGAVPLEPALTRIAADLESHYVATIAPTFQEDGAYHPLDIKVKRRDVSVRAPTGYWTPIAAERLTPSLRPPMSTYLKTPHISGLIQPWFRMARAPDGRTQVIFSWAPKPKAKPAANVKVSAVTFEGVKLHDSAVVAQSAGDNARVVFEALPGPIQVAMEITDRGGKVLDTEVRYLEVPKLDARGAMITAVEVVRTSSLPEFLARQTQPDVMPVDTRDFYRQDRLIVRVRALGIGDDSPVIRARLLNTRGQPMRDLDVLPSVDGIPQFDLPLFPFARGDYHIEIRATAGTSSVSQLVTFRLVG